MNSEGQAVAEILAQKRDCALPPAPVDYPPGFDPAAWELIWVRDAIAQENDGDDWRERFRLGTLGAPHPA